MAAPKRPRVPEKVEQVHVVRTFRGVGGRVWVLGTVRSRNKGRCPQCRCLVEVSDKQHFGTRQTPGISDVLAFVPDKRPGREGALRLVFVECKAEGGRPSEAQREFRETCLAAGADHVMGGLDEVLAWLVAAGNVRADNIPHYRRAAL